MKPSRARRAFRKAQARLKNVAREVTRDSVQIRVPKAYLSTLTLFFHHVSDAMPGDDRPDHGLAMMRRGREAYRDPFYGLYGSLHRAEIRMSGQESRAALRLLWKLQETKTESDKAFQEQLLSVRDRNWVK